MTEVRNSISQRSEDSYSEEVDEALLTLSDIIRSPSDHSRNDSRGSLVEEDNSVLESIMVHANTVLPITSEVAISRVRPRTESNNSVKDLIDKFSKNTATSQVSEQEQSRINFTGFDSFNEVRHGSEFGPNRSAFYPVPAVCDAPDDYSCQCTRVLPHCCAIICVPNVHGEC